MRLVTSYSRHLGAGVRDPATRRLERRLSDQLLAHSEQLAVTKLLISSMIATLRKPTRLVDRVRTPRAPETEICPPTPTGRARLYNLSHLRSYHFPIALPNHRHR